MLEVWVAPFESVRDRDFVLPTCTLPKLTVEALTDKLPGVVGFDGEVGFDGVVGEVDATFVPTQPKVNRMETINKTMSYTRQLKTDGLQT